MAHQAKQTLESYIAKAMKEVEIDGIYTHYRKKNNRYKVIAVGLQENTEKPCVIYQSLQSEKLIWVRNLDDWLTVIEQEDGQRVPRFQKVE